MKKYLQKDDVFLRIGLRDRPKSKEFAMGVDLSNKNELIYSLNTIAVFFSLTNLKVHVL